MSIYYHTFQIGFNFWFIALPFLLVVSVVISAMSETQFFWAYDLSTGRQLVRYHWYRRCDSTTCVLQAVAAITSTITVVALICLESWSGIQQYCRNYIAGDDILAADAAAVVIVIVCAIVVFALMAWAVNSGWHLAAAAVLVFDAVLVLAARRTNSRPVKGPDRYDQCGWCDQPDQQDETDPDPRS